ncbi:solute carrier family 25 member 47-B isoform X2 [Thunnus maccoyii]|uniref:solute carrier family 25 member 47-B isoform X2 n=1 Tax=Thunnus maccoyii TaxID=8240 RepID=UPI001C4DCB63|nr:solute carrier family 25 member 47-B isoform X2 [Thunnus maccoyii]
MSAKDRQLKTIGWSTTKREKSLPDSRFKKVNVAAGQESERRHRCPGNQKMMLRQFMLMKQQDQVRHMKTWLLTGRNFVEEEGSGEIKHLLVAEVFLLEEPESEAKTEAASTEVGRLLIDSAVPCLSQYGPVSTPLLLEVCTVAGWYVVIAIFEKFDHHSKTFHLMDYDESSFSAREGVISAIQDMDCEVQTAASPSAQHLRGVIRGTHGGEGGFSDIDRHTDIQTHRHIDTDIQAYRHIHTHIQTHRHTDRFLPLVDRFWII